MATSKLLRTPPPKKLENYVASIKRIFSDPETIPDSKFAAAGTYAVTFESSMLAGDADLGYSVSNPIGFDVTLNGKTYQEFSVSGAGWMMLRDPDGGTTGATWWYDVLDSMDPNANIFTNEYINSDFSYDHIVLAPWFDRMWVTSVNLTELKNGLYLTDITPTVESNIIKGADSNVWPYDTIDHGVRYVNGYDSKKGKYLLVRWTTTESQYNSRLKFEVALFENGTIEYRYWPRNQYKRPILYPSYLRLRGTIGAFWSGPSMGSNRFRDFSTLLDYDMKRSLSELGGSEYSPSYSETSVTYGNSKPYSLNVESSNWPKNGAVITFSPPVNLGKFLPRKLNSSISATRRLTSAGGLFDDRKTINFFSNGNVVVHMPSTLPSRLLGNTSPDVNLSLRQLLFTNGSLKITGSMKIGVIDSQLEVLDALDKLQEPSKNSFNESQKNYQETASVSDFYATGSSLEVFGNGFTAPLKSKTQFHFSLPVTKQTTMPESLPSFYYYDVDKKMWKLVDPDGYRQPASSFSYYREGEVAANLRFRDGAGTDESSSYQWPLYRVVETSRGFDAVGRKIVSGTNAIKYTIQTPSWFPLSYQTDSAIGSLYNVKRFDGDVGATFFPRTQFLEESKSAITREYRNSLTDNPNFFPQKSQMFDFTVDQPFLIEKVVVSVPLYINGEWFNDVTTCTRPYVDPTYSINDPNAAGRFIGPIDFGGPGITFALMCARRGEGPNNSYLDLIASGTITHVNDMTASVVLKKDPGMEHHSMRPTGFISFSNPTCVISGTNNVFEGSAKLEMEASVAGGLTFARNDRSYLTASFYYDGSPSAIAEAAAYVESNRDKAKFLLCSPELFTEGETFANTNDRISSEVSVPGAGFVNIVSVFDANPTPAGYSYRSPRIYLQQISPLSRGSSKMNFNGNSVLGGNIAAFNLENKVKNPLYAGYTKNSLPTDYTDQINSSSFRFDAVSLYSAVDSRPAPYLMLPGDKITISMSKTRPAIDRAKDSGTQFQPFMGGVGARYDEYILTGSHGTVMLNTGSINITVYGSYIQEGMEYHP